MIGGQVGVGVDLTVRVMERHPDLLALVLEDVHVFDLRPRAEYQRAMGPDSNQSLELLEAQIGRGRA